MYAKFATDDNLRGKPVYVLLVGNDNIKAFRQTLEHESELLSITEASYDSLIPETLKCLTPDVIVVSTDYLTAPEIFSDTLTTLYAMKLNSRTIVVSENPGRYLHDALEAKVAALVSTKTDIPSLILIIREIAARLSLKVTPSRRLINHDAEIG
jgi:DNA-binding NarL/FixJ family response regulator